MCGVLTPAGPSGKIDLRTVEDVMKRVLVLVFVILFAWVGAINAQEEPVEQEVQGITLGQFAVLILKAAAGYTGTLPDEVTALDQVKGYGLVPEDWLIDDVLTHGEFAEMLAHFGVSYLPADHDAPVSPPYAEAVLRREISRLRDYLARRMGHGFSVNHILDLGVDRAVSPSRFAND
jgi:hypothetical protein